MKFMEIAIQLEKREKEKFFFVFIEHEKPLEKVSFFVIIFLVSKYNILYLTA